MKQAELTTQTIIFDLLLRENELCFFRGAMIHIGGIEEMLLHNHTENGYRYAYPLVQYKIIQGHAAIVCVEKGIEEVKNILLKCPLTIKLGTKEKKLDILSLQKEKHILKFINTPAIYTLERWLPLNSKNYERFQLANGLKEKIEILEHILTSNILSCLKGLNIFWEEEICCHILTLSEPYFIYNKHTRMTGFNLSFSCNISLPECIGIGKNASIGCGLLHLQKIQIPS